MPQKDSSAEFQKIFADLNSTNRQYALAILRSLKFAEEQIIEQAKSSVPQKSDKPADK